MHLFVTVRLCLYSKLHLIHLGFVPLPGYIPRTPPDFPFELPSVFQQLSFILFLFSSLIYTAMHERFLSFSSLEFFMFLFLFIEYWVMCSHVCNNPSHKALLTAESQTNIQSLEWIQHLNEVPWPLAVCFFRNTTSWLMVCKTTDCLFVL